MAIFVKRTAEPMGYGQQPQANYSDWANQMQQLNRAALSQRIPDAPALEQASSSRIEELLNPEALFADTSRYAAEASAGRGVSGSPAAGGTFLRMTDEERLRRIALGQDMLTAAYGRNPIAPLPDMSYFLTPPAQMSELAMKQQQLAQQKQLQDAQVQALRKTTTTPRGYSGGYTILSPGGLGISPATEAAARQVYKGYFNYGG